MRDTPKRVLVVDDAALVRNYYRRILEGQGILVEDALNGLEALEKALQQAFDLLVVDVNMPQMDGLTFVEHLRRQDARMAAVPVLMTSTESSPLDIAAARTAGANFYLVKPVAPADLLEAVALMTGMPR